MVHLTGGATALMASFLVGPRTERFFMDPSSYHDAESGPGVSYRSTVVMRDLAGHSPALSYLGACFLAIGWLFFNASADDNTEVELAGKVMTNTLLSMLSAVSLRVAWRLSSKGSHDLMDVINAMLGGGVASTACCAQISTGCAVAVGVMAGVVTPTASRLVQRLRIDDPLDASAVHGANGLLSLLSVGLFSNSRGVEGVLVAVRSPTAWRQFGVQCLGGLAITVWSLLVCWVALKVVAQLRWWKDGAVHPEQERDSNPLRVRQQAELLGLDFKYHAGYAYDDLDRYEVKVANLTKAAEMWAKQKRVRKEKNRLRGLGLGRRRQQHEESAPTTVSSLHSSDGTYPNHDQWAPPPVKRRPRGASGVRDSHLPIGGEEAQGEAPEHARVPEVVRRTSAPQWVVGPQEESKGGAPSAAETPAPPPAALHGALAESPAGSTTSGGSRRSTITWCDTISQHSTSSRAPRQRNPSQDLQGLPHVAGPTGSFEVDHRHQLGPSTVPEEDEVQQSSTDSILRHESTAL